MAKQPGENITDPTDEKNIYKKPVPTLTFKEFIHRFQIPICIFFGMAGFVYSIVLLAYSGDSGFTPYGEIVIKNKVQIVDSLLDRRMAALKDTIKKLNAKKPVTEADKVELPKSSKMAAQILKNTLAEKYALDYGKTDTGMAIFNQYLFPDRKVYLDTIHSVCWDLKPKMEAPIRGFAIDTCRFFSEVPIKYPVTFRLAQNKRRAIMDFVTDYPQFGLWIVVTIAQMTLWFLLFPLLTGNVLSLQSKFKKSYQISISGILTNSIVPLLFIAVFLFCFYVILADNLVVRDEYFLTGFNTRMFWYAFPGYLVATYGFGSYISIARQVDKIDKTPARASIVEVPSTNVNELYSSLKKAFDNAFLASAIILSLFVVWSSVNFNALNSLETIRFYKGLSGRTLIPGDFIYLMGLLHTCILLIFYLPVKLKFNSLDITKTAGAPDPNDSALKRLFGTLSDSLGTIMVTTSPMIASLVHTIFTTLQK